MRNSSKECPGVDMDSVNITDGSTSYNITGLEEDSNYTITVTATNAAGNAVSNPISGTTREAGERLSVWYEYTETHTNNLSSSS